MTNLIVLLVMLATSLPASAQFLPEGTLTSFRGAGDYYAGGANRRGHIYVVPNEINPEGSRAILAKAGPGVYLSVGAERGLTGALLSPKITHLVQMDLVPEVALYNQLNVILLKMSRDLPDYLRLRQSSQAEWLERAQNSSLNLNESALLHSADDHRFYHDAETAARERFSDARFFKGSSFLREPTLFEKARRMAIDGKIQVLQGNLTDLHRLRKLSDDLHDRGLSISVFDMSNAWEEKYIGPRGVDAALVALGPALEANSIFMATEVSRCLEPHLCYWDFRGITVEHLRKAKEFFRGLLITRRYVEMKASTPPNKLLSTFGFWKYGLKARFTSLVPRCEDLFGQR